MRTGRRADEVGAAESSRDQAVLEYHGFKSWVRLRSLFRRKQEWQDNDPRAIDRHHRAREVDAPLIEDRDCVLWCM